MPNPNQLLAKIEERHLWAYFHKDWLLEIRGQIRLQLPATYHVFVESEAILLTPETDEVAATSMPDLAVAGAPSESVVKQPQTISTITAVIEYDEPYEI